MCWHVYDMLILVTIQKNMPLADFLISSNCTLDTIFLNPVPIRSLLENWQDICSEMMNSGMNCPELLTTLGYDFSTAIILQNSQH